MQTPCIVHVVLLFSLFLSSVFVCYTHAIYVSSCPSIAMASEDTCVRVSRIRKSADFYPPDFGDTEPERWRTLSQTSAGKSLGNGWTDGTISEAEDNHNVSANWEDEWSTSWRRTSGNDHNYHSDRLAGPLSGSTFAVLEFKWRRRPCIM